MQKMYRMYCDTVDLYRSTYGITYQMSSFEEWIAQQQQQQQHHHHHQQQ